MKTTNQEFPHVFYYKGWEITIKNVSTILTIEDLKLSVSIIPNKDLLEHQLQETIRKRTSNGSIETSGPIYLEDTNTYSTTNAKRNLALEDEVKPIVEDFCKNKCVHNYTFVLNGNALTNMVGQNINRVNKAKFKVIAYVDSMLSNVKDEFFDFFKNSQRQNV